MTVVKPGGIVSALRHTFQAPPPPRELPSARLLRHAFLLAEANNVQDYRSQILSTFGTVLKMDSTKKVVKKLSGEGGGSAEWFTSIENEHSQIVSFVLTCEESTEKLKPMCLGVMERFRLANQPGAPQTPRAKGHTGSSGKTFRLIHLAIEELKGPAGLDESGVSLFKTPEAIDEMWAGQQRHLECIQDPPDMNMYRVARTTTINNVDLPYYKCLRGSNSLEGFHKALPNMIPGRHHRTYSAPLIDRLNARCQQLLGETVEENFRAPADVSSNELPRVGVPVSARARGNLGPSLFRTLSTMDLVQKRRCSDLGSLIQMTQTRRTRAMWRHTTVRWMRPAPHHTHQRRKPPLFTLRPL
ncbi:hypothetical protein J4Q44_G00266790 [Coregonus suidteri]|uniref:Uncharacterized protein n=1 Tax=Coregonus suidteri TaxID=861788 RepID=A0AAN8L680_9TELE